jgi:hypothetical protein
MSEFIQIQWVGHRKDGSSRGAIAGWFIRTGDFAVPACNYWDTEAEIRRAYIFWGRIGTTLHIEERTLTSDFLDHMKAKTSNFKQVDPAKIMSKWGKSFNDELSMQIMVMKLRG